MHFYCMFSSLLSSHSIFFSKIISSILCVRKGKWDRVSEWVRCYFTYIFRLEMKDAGHKMCAQDEHYVFVPNCAVHCKYEDWTTQLWTRFNMPGHCTIRVLWYESWTHKTDTTNIATASIYGEHQHVLLALAEVHLKRYNLLFFHAQNKIRGIPFSILLFAIQYGAIAKTWVMEDYSKKSMQWNRHESRAERRLDSSFELVGLRVRMHRQTRRISSHTFTE